MDAWWHGSKAKLEQTKWMQCRCTEPHAMAVAEGRQRIRWKFLPAGLVAGLLAPGLAAETSRGGAARTTPPAETCSGPFAGHRTRAQPDRSRS
jgi:hypothetical protein